MLKFILPLMTLVLIFSAFPAHSADDCPPVEAVVDQMKKEKKEAKHIIDDVVKLPTKDQLLNCIKGISFNDKFSLGTITLMDLFNQFCQEINSRIDEQLTSLQNNISYSPYPGININSSGGVSRTGQIGLYRKQDIVVQDHSDQIEKDVINQTAWEKYMENRRKMRKNQRDIHRGRSWGSDFN